MATETTPLQGPDLRAGIAESELREGVPLLGHAGDDAIVLVKSEGDVYAIAASCTHYGGPLAEGLVTHGTITCPLHHACFELRNGRASAPALEDVACFDVVRADDLVRVGDKRPRAARGKPRVSPSSIVLVGSGAASAACAETLRREGYDGVITMIGEEAPIDRPNVSKDYLAGTAPEEWMPLRPLDFYRDQKIDLVSGTVSAIDTKAHRVETASGPIAYGALLVATGAEPFVLPIAGARSPHVHTVRTLADARSLIAANAKRAVVIGSSFIGLETAASLRARGVEVTVVGMEAVPLERVLGKVLGERIQKEHESHGVTFRLGRKPTAIDATHVTLEDDTKLPADLVILGTGVRPRVALAEAAGIRVENGIVVDEHLRASAPDVYAAGDVARFPHRGGLARIEHWVHAERQGQHVARAMLGDDAPFDDVPFFWSAHYDLTIRYVGHSEKSERITVEGSVESRELVVSFYEAGRVAAVATLGRDRASLEAAAALAR